MLHSSPTPIKDLLVLTPDVFGDHRGFFLESFNQRQFDELVGHHVEFVQDNQSLSAKNILRGLHLQHPPHAQGKLVSVVKGSVYDVVVDLRTDSNTFGQHFGIELSAENHKMLWIPPGFAHGFLTLEDDTLFTYKCSGYYHQAAEETIQWNDSELNIEWPTENPILSEKDMEGTPFNEFRSLF